MSIFVFFERRMFVVMRLVGLMAMVVWRCGDCQCYGQHANKEHSSLDVALAPRLLMDIRDDVASSNIDKESSSNG